MRKSICIGVLLIGMFFFGCISDQNQKETEKIYSKCLENLRNESDPTHKFIGVETHTFDGSKVEMCCAEVIGEKGKVKYCFEPVLSELSPIDYRTVIFWRMHESGGNVKLLEGYEKEGKFFWVAYTEEGKFDGRVEYYKKDNRICAKIFNSESQLVGDICE